MTKPFDDLRCASRLLVSLVLSLRLAAGSLAIDAAQQAFPWSDLVIQAARYGVAAMRTKSDSRVSTDAQQSGIDSR